MNTKFVNALHNPQFAFMDYGAGPFTTSGYTASRWKMTITGSPSVSVSQGTNGSTSATERWYREKTNLSINVSSYTAASDTIVIRQHVEDSAALDERIMTLSGIAFGPSGQHFYVGVGNNFQKVDTLGQSGGVDVPTHFSFTLTVPAQPTAFLAVDIFTRPSSTGTYKIAFAQLQVGSMETGVAPFELRSPETERRIMARYVHPVPANISGVTSTTSAFFGVPFPVPMRTMPTYTALKTAIGDLSLVSLTGGVSSTSTVLTNHATSDMTASGARLALQNGWSGLTNGGATMLATSGIGVFSADW